MCEKVSKKCCTASAGVCAGTKGKCSSGLVSLLGNAKIMKNNGGDLEPIDKIGDYLQNKLVAFYFSAHWCPPCRQFTPVLKKFYEEAAKDGFEIIFMSRDHTEVEYNQYIEDEHGDWCVAPFGHVITEKLQTRFEVKSIPTLVIVKCDGEPILKNAWAAIQNRTKTPQELVQQWKKQAEM